MPEVDIKSVSFAGWNDCIKISNGLIELIATKNVGPRIVRFGFVGEKNELAIKDKQAGKTGGEKWKLYGGHRLWHSPEKEPRTYVPDNGPIEVTKKKEGVKLVQPTEEWTQIQKEIKITMNPSNQLVEVNHRLTNKGAWPIEFAPWSITVLDSGGVAILPLKRGDPDALLPDRSISLWPYSNMDDPRVEFDDEFIFLSQDTEIDTPFKIGAHVKVGWTAYVNDGHAFIKYFPYQKDEIYPDLNSTVESYTDDFMLELETLGPMQKIDTYETVEHVETWELFKTGKTNSLEDKKKIARKILERG